ncbi:MAG: MBL fold metallo-hydrolase [Methanosarcinaceae archaeon]|nr:MBL fold metallo-hydrolase [Methanosarcinaceae archaeon]MDF1534070.1 MBL fold metallo-hydrolase [Methanosarcinaceae archaeon]
MNVEKINASPYDANIYLINKKILIDTGMSPRSLYEEIEKHIDPKNIELIILTHCHYDHTGAATEIEEKCGAKVAIHRDDMELLNDNTGSVASMFGHPAPTVIPSIIYEGGEHIPISNTENLEVIHTPGHTPGGICLYEPVSKSLFSGDTVFPQGSIGRTDFIGGSSDELTKSIEKLTQLDVNVLYPGHGIVTDDNVNAQIHMSLQMSAVMR